MKIRFMLMVAAAAVSPISSANARVLSDEERDAIYQQCYELYLALPGKTENDANAYCYPRAYGTDVTGGGDPNVITIPVPGQYCHGSCAIN